MKELKAALIGTIARTASVTSFRFVPGEKINFLPGQAAQLIFDERDQDNRELNKYLSFSCSPAKDYVEFTKRLSTSRFSEALKDLKTGDEIFIKAPLGNCAFSESEEKIAFLIGGIGITPVISIIEYIIDKRLNTEVSLIYSNRTENDVAFKAELDRWQAMNKKIKVSYIYGVIDRETIRERIYELDKRVVFIFGPPAMVEAMVKLCADLGCSKENIKTERFIGY